MEGSVVGLGDWFRGTYLDLALAVVDFAEILVADMAEEDAAAALAAAVAAAVFARWSTEMSALIPWTFHFLKEQLSYLYHDDRSPKCLDHSLPLQSCFVMRALKGMRMHLQILIWRNLVGCSVVGMTAMAKSLLDDRDQWVGRNNPWRRFGHEMTLYDYY